MADDFLTSLKAVTVSQLLVSSLISLNPDLSWRESFRRHPFWAQDPNGVSESFI